MGGTIRTAIAVFATGLLAATAHAGSTATYLGPTAYLSADDSPFPLKSFGFCNETFEDGTFDVPGATGDGEIVGPGSLTDSVDGDDGAIDGSGTGGHSYFSQNGSAGISITFDVARTNGLPTSVGIVWTDGGAGAPISFEAFGPGGLSLGVHGPYMHADDGNYGTTAEDRFYGVTSPDGISKVNISNTLGGIEADHLQLNNCILCGDANFDLRVTASDALLALKTSVGSETCLLCVCDTNNSTSNTASDALAILKKSVGLAPPMNCPACAFA